MLSSIQLIAQKIHAYLYNTSVGSVFVCILSYNVLGIMDRNVRFVEEKVDWWYYFRHGQPNRSSNSIKITHVIPFKNWIKRIPIQKKGENLQPPDLRQLSLWPSHYSTNSNKSYFYSELCWCLPVAQNTAIGDFVEGYSNAATVALAVYRHGDYR